MRHTPGDEAQAGLVNAIAASYDSMPYESFPFPQTAPEHLRAVARSFGLPTAPVATARVLELGCAAGGNLIPIARRHPGARLIGVDLSAVQVGQGRAVIQASGLENVELRAGSIADIDTAWGRFDYIICHGVYSWVPPEIQRAILRVCAENLSEEGVAYVSYNTYPGWKFREVMRDAMLLRGSGRRTPQEQLGYARGMLDFLHEKAAPGSALKVALDENMPLIRSGQAHYLIHEFLEPCNAPCYFKDFLQAASAQGLGYLAESEITLMFASNHPQAVVEPLLRECGTQVELEQYLDFVGNRSFRQTLLVHASRQAGIRYRLDAARVRELHFAGRFQLQAGDRPGPAARYTGWHGHGLSLGTPLAQAVAAVFDGLYPATCDFQTLVRAVASASGPSAAHLQGPLTALLEELLIKGHLRPRAEPLACSGAVPARPRRSPGIHTWTLPPAAPGAPARMLACGPWHETVPLNVVESHVIGLSNGERDHAALLAELHGLQRSGELRFMRDEGSIVEDPAQGAELARVHLDAALARLARCGLFEPEQPAGA